MYDCTLYVTLYQQRIKNTNLLKSFKMENYNDFSVACDVLAHAITDRDFVSVKSLVMAAASLYASCSEVVRDICTLIDRFTGCGFAFVSSEVVKIHVKFFDD